MKTEPQHPGSVPVSKKVEEIVRQRLAELGDEKGKPWPLRLGQKAKRNPNSIRRAVSAAPLSTKFNSSNIPR
jgi:hypothetical protein